MLDQSSVAVPARVNELAARLFTAIMFVVDRSGDMVPMLRVDPRPAAQKYFYSCVDQSSRVFLDDCVYRIWWPEGRPDPERIEYDGPVFFARELGAYGADKAVLDGEKLDYLLELFEAS